MVKMFILALLFISVCAAGTEIAKLIIARAQAGRLKELLTKEGLEDLAKEAKEDAEELYEEVKEDAEEMIEQLKKEIEERVNKKEEDEVQEIAEPEIEEVEEEIVYVNDGGSSSKKFHKSIDAHHMDGGKPMKRSEAEEAGFVPCAKCFKKGE